LLNLHQRHPKRRATWTQCCSM